MKNKETKNETLVSSTIDEQKAKNKRFWRYFWATIIVLAILFIGLNITASKKLSEMSKVDREARLENIFNQFKTKYPEFMTMTKSLNSNSLKEIKRQIDISINKAYQPIYGQIDNFSDFHYSVKGEYTELGTVLFGEVENILEEQLFKPSNFQSILTNELKNINTKSTQIIIKQFKNLKQDIKSKMNLDDEEITFLLSNILKLSQEDMKFRMSSYTNNLFKGMGLGGGAVAGSAMMTKLMSKKISKIIAKKIATKIAVKTGTKAVGAGASAVAGAEAGLFCGPGAWFCSPAGAVIGGIIGWFATDKIVVEIDGYYNKDDFKQNIRELIDVQKQNMKNTLYKIYTDSFIKVNSDTINSFDNIKNKSVKEILIDNKSS